MMPSLQACAHLVLSQINRQLLTFIVIGIAHNGGSYLVYLLLTYYGMSPNVAVTILYPIGIAISFFANKKFTFKNRDSLLKTGIAYTALYVSGYCINLAFLYLFYEHMGIPHQLVQIGTTFVLAAYFFFISKFMIFSR